MMYPMSKITLPSGKVIEIKDAYARQLLARGLNFIICWDGNSVPVVADIPAGVKVTYNNVEYVGTKPATSAEPLSIYLVMSPTQVGENDYYDEYVATGRETKKWEKLGDTRINLDDIPVEKGSGQNSVQQKGTGAVASGIMSFAEGNGTKATNTAEHAEGAFNKSNTGTRHSVGIGTADNARKNAFEIMENGDAYLFGVGGYDGTNPSEAKTIKECIDNSENHTFIINPGVTTWQEVYDAYQAGKLVYYKGALCEYFSVEEGRVEGSSFSALVRDGDATVNYMGIGYLLSEAVPISIPGEIVDINAEEVINTKQENEILPNDKVTQEEIDSLFDGGGGGGSGSGGASSEGGEGGDQT